MSFAAKIYTNWLIGLTDMQLVADKDIRDNQKPRIAYVKRSLTYKGLGYHHRGSEYSSTAGRAARCRTLVVSSSA